MNDQILKAYESIVDTGWQDAYELFEIAWQAATLAAKRQPLTDEQVRAISLNTCTAEPGRDGFILPYSFTRAIEAAHGIKA